MEGNGCTNVRCYLRLFGSQIGGIDMELFRVEGSRDAVTYMKNTLSSSGTAYQVRRKESQHGQVLSRLEPLLRACQQSRNNFKAKTGLFW